MATTHRRIADSGRRAAGAGLSVLCVCLIATGMTGCERGTAGDREPAGVAVRAEASTGPGDRPNVVLITIDTLRADHCSCYGYYRPTTPHLDALARRGTLLETVYAVMPTTGPSHATLFTSQYPAGHGVLKNGFVLGDDKVTRAEVLRAREYETAAVVSSYAVAGRFGLSQGFDFYDDDFENADSSIGRDWPMWEGHRVEGKFDRRARDTSDRAIEWLRRRDAGGRYFLWVHYFDPHSPYDPPEPYRTDFARSAAAERAGGIDARKSSPVIRQASAAERARVIDAYDGEVRFADEEVGRLLAAIEEQSSPHQTLTIVAGDHGEGLYQHGWLEHGAYLLYEEAVRVPLVVCWPGRVPAGRRVAGATGLIDVSPTVLSLLGLSAQGLSPRGRDQSPIWTGRREPDGERVVFRQRRLFKTDRVLNVSVAGSKDALRVGRWKLIHAPDEHTLELFDLVKDPKELDNLAERRPRITQTLMARLESWRARQAATGGDAPEQTLSPQAVERLKALGYVE